MKKYLVIGNPIDHSLSPKLHNYWIAQNKIQAIYEKKLINKNDIEKIINDVREKKIHGINVTVPFKKDVISYVDQLSTEAKETESVNTIYLKNDKIIGHNTDIEGFELNIKHIKFNVTGKKIFILGAGGVVPSIIYALNRLKVSEIIISNRTKEKAENLKNLFKNITVINWGKVPDFDIVINATSLGLNKNDVIGINFLKTQKNNLFYDVIYNPRITNFLKTGKELGYKTENGKMMFIYQALAAFEIWHNVKPQISNEVLKLLD